MMSLRALLLAAVALLALLASPARAGLPTGTANDLQRCQTFAQQAQSGQIPPDACLPDTQATLKRCIAYGVQFGAISQADANALIANLEAYCAQQAG